jgi:uncharacterized protein (TIGR03085 family)
VHVVILSRQTTAVLRAERAELLGTLRSVGPDAPTLCDGWTAATLAAHIVVSEQQAGVPLSVAYPIWRVASARTGAKLRGSATNIGDRRMVMAEARGWDWLLRRLASGPPRLFGVRLIAELRLVEEFIHHEDVRRANGGQPRTLSAPMSERLLAGMLAISEIAMFAEGRAGIEVRLRDGQAYRVGDGEARVQVTGDVGEVTLWLAGRGSAADVDVDGEIIETALRV